MLFFFSKFGCKINNFFFIYQKPDIICFKLDIDVITISFEFEIKKKVPLTSYK